MIIREYGKSDFPTLQELRGYDGGIGTAGEGNTGGSGNLQDGRGSNRKTRIDFSLSDKVSSDDGIFFDGKNTDGWNVSGEDIALEDIGPVRNDLETTQENQSEWDLLEEWLNESKEAKKEQSGMFLDCFSEAREVEKV